MYYGPPCTFLLLFISIMYFLTSFSSTIMYYIVFLILNKSSLKKQKNIPMQHRYKTELSTVTALHTLNNTVAKGFNQMAPPCANNHCST